MLNIFHPNTYELKKNNTAAKGKRKKVKECFYKRLRPLQMPLS